MVQGHRGLGEQRGLGQVAEGMGLGHTGLGRAEEVPRLVVAGQEEVGRRVARGVRESCTAWGRLVVVEGRARRATWGVGPFLVVERENCLVACQVWGPEAKVSGLGV